MVKVNAKRLNPLTETLRELFLKSRNCCAFPKCQRKMMDSDGIFIGQICHIEAAEDGGERGRPVVTLSLGMTVLVTGAVSLYLVIVMLNRGIRPVLLENFYLLLNDGRRLLFSRNTLTGQGQPKRRAEPGDPSEFHIEALDLKRFGMRPEEYICAGRG